MDIRVKIITGYRKDQEYSISAEEAHKAYFLFLNPEKRGVFNNGLAIKGEEINKIEPDYNGTMGWAPTHILSGDDWGELRKRGVDKKIREIMAEANRMAQEQPEMINIPMTEALEAGAPLLNNAGGKQNKST